MKASFYFYKGKLQTLPKGIFFLIIILILLIIPLLATLFLLATTTTILFKTVSKLILPRKSDNNKFVNYEIIDDAKNVKQLK